MKQPDLVDSQLHAPSGKRLTGMLQQRLPGLLPAGLVRRVTREADDSLSVQLPGTRRLRVVVRAAAVPSRVREWLHQLRQDPSKAHPVLASTFLSERVRAICREEKVGYIDLAGNFWLDLEGLYIERTVAENPFPARGRPPSLFAPISSRIIRAMLEEPACAWQVSELAEATAVSLGQASNVSRRLVDEAYAVREDRQLRLQHPDRLLDAWRDHEPLAKARQLLYYSFERAPETLMPRVAEAGRQAGLRYALTGMAGASLVAPFVRGVGLVHCYVEDEAAAERWVSAMDLRPVASGPNLALLIPPDPGVFYRAQQVDGIAVVGSIQLYLDTWRDPARGREQAEFLREHVLHL